MTSMTSYSKKAASQHQLGQQLQKKLTTLIERVTGSEGRGGSNFCLF